MLPLSLPSGPSAAHLYGSEPTRRPRSLSMIIHRRAQSLRPGESDRETAMNKAPPARNNGRQGLCALLLYAVGAAAANAAPGPGVVLPALTDPASGEHHVGKVIWTDLVTPDLNDAKRFYGALFGWTFRDVQGDSHYALALA